MELLPVDDTKCEAYNDDSSSDNNQNYIDSDDNNDKHTIGLNSVTQV